MKILKISFTVLLIISVLSTTNQVFSQVPYINSIDITNGTAGEKVTIAGSNFSSNPADLVVKFGGAQATITSATTNLLEVTVPNGATFDNISVTNTSGNTVKTGYSNELFNVSFGGSTGISAAAFDPQELINEQALDISTYDLCLCDFDLDGTTDIAVSNNGSQNIILHENNSTVAASNFIRTTLSPGFATINITCGDLDGDGFPDLVATEGDQNNERLFIFRNLATGGLDFSAPTTLTIPRDGSNIRFIRRVAIQDLDLDGKPDLVLTNTSDNIIDVFKNNSTQGSILMNTTSQQFPMIASDGRSAGLAGLDVKDLNNDGLPEIIAIFNRQSDVYILPNSSEPGTISFETSLEISANGGFQNLKVGDMNQDGFNDIVLTAGTAGTPQNSIVIVENQTSVAGGAIAMASRATVSNIIAPWGLDLGDIDGDGSIDIAVASVGSPGRIFLLWNSDPANFTFSSTSVSTTSNSRNVKIGDLNGDGKPDLAFSHNITAGQQGELSVLLNRNCIIPKITPTGVTEVCTGQVFDLKTNMSPSATYTWLINGLDQGVNNSSFTVNTGAASTAAAYTVKVTDVSCDITSDPVNITIRTAGITPPNATSSAGTAVQCAGSEVTLMTGATFTSYEWTGPGNFTSTDQNPVISSISQEMTGNYSVVGRDASGCISEASEVTVLVENVPVIAVNNDDEDIFCVGSSATLSVTDFGSSYSYKWEKDNVEIPSQTNTSLTVSESGAYSAVIVSNGNNCEFKSQPRTLTTVVVPVNSITSDPVSGLICKDLPIAFIAPAGDQNGQAITHTWDFGDSSPTENGVSVNHTYTDASTPTVTLTTTYTDLANCPSTVANQNITVQAVPNTTGGSVIDISTATGETSKCPSDILGLSLTDTFTNYSWSSTLEPGIELSTTNSFDASRPARGDSPTTYTVSARDAAQCDFSANVEISLKSALGISIETLETTTDSDADGVQEINLVEDQLSVDLSVLNATDISWTPEEIFDNPTAEMVTAIPNDIDILVRVFGTDPEGCLESDSIRVINPIIRAKSVFSPNGDGIGDECWEITNARSKLDGCTIFIFDSKGQIIKEEEISSQTQIDDCIWDGTESGQVLPEGIYYYALKCVNNADITAGLSGSILLGR